MNDREEREFALGLIGAGYTTELRKQALACVAPIFWFDASREAGTRVLSNGTFFFLKLPEICLGVTACHVYDAYIEVASTLVSPTLIIGKTPCELAARLVSRSPELDLVTFRFEPEEVTREFKRTPHEPAVFPLPRLPDGTGVHFLGFPGRRRHEDERGVHWRPFEGSGLVRWTSDQRLAVQFERDFVVQDPEWETLPENEFIGGVSGGPLFGHFSKGGIVFQQIIGVVSQASEKFEIFFFQPLDCIGSDGQVQSMS